MTTVPDALLALAPHLTELERRMEDGQGQFSPLALVRTSAMAGQKSFFSKLPPMLLHEDARPTANKLYGGARTSPVEHAAFRAGRFDDISLAEGCTVLGAALFDLNDRSYPVLLYEHRKGGKGGKGASVVVAHAYEAPLAELEAQLFDERVPTTPLEARWLGTELAETTRRLRLATGAYQRSCGLSSMPGMLLTGDFHLVRPGILPWLHFRGPRTDHERDVLLETVAAGLASCPAHSCAPVEWQDELDAPSGAQRLLTVFDRARAPVGGAPAPPTDAERLVQGSRWGRLVDVARGILGVRDGHAHGRARELLADSPALPVRELEEASDMARVAPAKILSTLTGMVTACGVVGLSRIGLVHGHAALEKIAATAFVASDAVLAFRDVDDRALSSTSSTSSTSTSSSTSRSLVGCKNMAGRIDEPQAMLIIDLDLDYGVSEATLINSALAQPVGALDEMARLIACPWVVVVLHREAADGLPGWLALDTSLVARDKLRVTEQVRVVRLASGAAPAWPAAAVKPPPLPLPLPPPPPPAALEQLRSDVNERLERVEKHQKQQKHQKHLLPAPAPESLTVERLRADVATLTRLVRKRALTAR